MTNPQARSDAATAPDRLGPLLVVSGPSGSGKSTVIARLLAEPDLVGRLRLSVSATTRRPRPGEVDGVHYHFWTPDHFAEELRAGAFLEHAEVYGRWYGTLLCEVEPYRTQGMGVILDLDVQGATAIRRLFPDAVLIFLRTHSLETYEARLRKRGTEEETAIQQRLAAARSELAHAGEYRYSVINEDLDAAVAELGAIVRRHLK
jgi:guanylate kinase